MATVRYWSYRNGGQLQPLDGGSPIDPPDPPPTTALWWIGFSRSLSGLGGTQVSKQPALAARITDFATATGQSEAAIKSFMICHTYVTNSWTLSSIANAQYAVNNGWRGAFVNTKLASATGTTELTAWANGDYDTQFTTLLNQYAATGKKFIVTYEHEPENNGWTTTQAALWCQGTARFMKIVYDLGNPNIVYSTCHIPAGPPAGSPLASVGRAAFNPKPALTSLYGATMAQTLMDASLCGMDIYPEIENDGTTLQTLAGRLTSPMADYRSWGWTRFFLPEVAFFNYKKDKSGPGSLDAAGQALRLYDQLWVWCQANGIEGFCYFDVTSPSNPRGDSRTLDTPDEQAMYVAIAERTL